MALNEKQKAYVLNQFIKKHDRAPGKKNIRLSKKDVLTLDIDRGVLGSDLMIPAINLAMFLHRNTMLYKAKRVLEMGCGAGPQGIICTMNGAAHIDYSDINPKAVKNCKKNLKAFNIYQSSVYEGDLYEPIPPKQYDVIIFNNPFFPELPENFEGDFLNDPVLLGGLLGGTELLKKFYIDSKKYLAPEGIIIQPFLHLAGKENDPAIRAIEYGFEVEKYRITTENGIVMKDEQDIYISSISS